MTLLLKTCLLLVMPAVLVAQPAPIAPSVPADAADSAAAARAEYRLARESLARGDTAGAMNKLAAAVRAFPPQPAYTNALLTLSVLARNTNYARIALTAANAIGVAIPASADTGGNSVRNMRELDSLLKRQEWLRKPVANSRAFRLLADSSLFPEGLSADSRTGVLYVTSLHHRNILAVTPDGASRYLLGNSEPEIGALYGVEVDTVRNVLWATSATAPGMQPRSPADSTLSALLCIRLSDGRVIRRFPMKHIAPNASPGDMALAANGDVLVSDSQAGVLWWLRGNADSLVAIRHHLFRSLQGIVPSPDGKSALVADYSHGLLRVELASGTVHRVADLNGHTTTGMDGLVRYRNTLIGVQNAYAPYQVVQLTLDASSARIVKHEVIDRNSDAMSPTGGIIVGNTYVYIANSLWDLVEATGKLPDGAQLRKPLLLTVPLKP